MSSHEDENYYFLTDLFAYIFTLAFTHRACKGLSSRSAAVTVGCITHPHKHQKLLRIQCKNRAWEVCSYRLGVLAVDPFPCPLRNLRLWLSLDPSVAFKSQFKDP